MLDQVVSAQDIILTALPKPIPAKQYAVKVSRALKGEGIIPGDTVTVLQMNITYRTGEQEPLLEVGKPYLLFPVENDRGLDLTNAPHVAVEHDHRLSVTHPVDGRRNYLQELEGLTPEEGVQKILDAIGPKG